MAFIWQLSILVLSSKTIIKGVVLKTKPPRKKNRISVAENLLMLIMSYASRPLKNTEIKIKLDNKESKVLTNKQGMFELELDFSLEKKT